MADIIWPSENNVGQFMGVNSNRVQEYQMARYFDAIKESRLKNFVSNGWTLTAGSGLSVNIATGYGVLDGRWIETSDTRSLSGLF